MKEKYCIPLDEEIILKLPYYAHSANCIHLTSKRKEKKDTKDIPTKKNNTFTINLSRSINKLRNKEISEIKYHCRKYGSIKIYAEKEGHLTGEYTTKTKVSLIRFIKKLSIF